MIVAFSDTDGSHIVIKGETKEEFTDAVHAVQDTVPECVRGLIEGFMSD